MLDGHHLERRGIGFCHVYGSAPSRHCCHCIAPDSAQRSRLTRRSPLPGRGVPSGPAAFVFHEGASSYDVFDETLWRTPCG